MVVCDMPVNIKLDKPKWSAQGWIYNVPAQCGKCLKCRERRINQWAWRLEREEDLRLSSWFVTLTYDTLSVPITEKGYMTLDIVEVQKFNKRLRINRGRKWKDVVDRHGRRLKNLEYKYFAVGEYGSLGRPHYHLIMYDVEPMEIIEAWGDRGIVDVQKIGSGAIRYVLKYIMKDGKDIPWYKDVHKEFNVQSQGLGLGYLDERMLRWYRKSFDRNYGRSREGFKVSLPKVFRARIWETQDERDDMLRHIRKRMKELEVEERNQFQGTDEEYGRKKWIGKEARNVWLKKRFRENVRGNI